ncbi:MAG: peptidoglycan-binding protein, partial [Rhodospirillales bacterium]|nr:peptidoglycan-binding protein [Rhodospirillales bacterium]
VAGISAAAAVACSFYILSGTGAGTVTPPPLPPRTAVPTPPRLPPPPTQALVDPAPAAAAPPPKIAPAAPVEPKVVEPKAAEPKTVTPAPGKDILGRNEILELQTRLKALGLSPGPLDGVAGPQTAAAVRRYEESRGQPPTGFVDRDLLIQLQQEPPSRTTGR